MSRLLLLIVCFTVGCTADFEDVSDEPKYKPLLEAEFVTKQALKLYGVSWQANYGDQIDVFVVTSPPGFDGPEVVNRDSLPPGTRLRVTRVMSCGNCFPDRIKFQIEVEDDRLESGVPVEWKGVEGCIDEVKRCHFPAQFFDEI